MALIVSDTIPLITANNLREAVATKRAQVEKDASVSTIAGRVIGAAGVTVSVGGFFVQWYRDVQSHLSFPEMYGSMILEITIFAGSLIFGHHLATKHGKVPSEEELIAMQTKLQTISLNAFYEEQYGEDSLFKVEKLKKYGYINSDDLEHRVNALLKVVGETRSLVYESTRLDIELRPRQDGSFARAVRDWNLIRLEIARGPNPELDV